MRTFLLLAIFLFTSTLFCHAQGTITECVLTSNCFDSNGEVDIPDPVGEPYIWDETGSGCKTGIARYLSRAANVDDLAEYIFDFPWDEPGSCDGDYSDSWDKYCPDTYCELINSLADANIQFFSRVVSPWFLESEFAPGGGLFLAAEQVVRDINAAYDCRGQRRPIIQAGIFEGVAEGVQSVPISDELLIDALTRGLITQAEYDLVYPRSPRNFIRANMFRQVIGGDGELKDKYDLTQLETRLWFFYLGTTYIEMGYTAIHMGIYWEYAQFDDGYEVLDQITSIFRDIAAEKNPPESFVLLNGEAPGPGTDNGESAIVGGSDPPQFIFDFEDRAMRIRELTNENGSTGDNDCNNLLTNEELNMFENTPCENQEMPGFIDPCVVFGFGGDVSGLSPSGCWLDEMPYYVRMDFGSGIVHDSYIHWDSVQCDSSGNPYVAYEPTDLIPGTYTHVNQPLEGFTWGRDDTRWFAEVLSEPCRSWWWNHFYCKINKEFNGTGFLQIPGSLIIKRPEHYCIEDPENLSDGRFVLSDDAALLNEVQTTLVPEEPIIDVEENCMELFTCLSICNAQHAPTGYKWQGGRNQVTVSVGNSDCSSIYSIHIKKPDGSWMPSMEGESYTFTVLEDGYYELFIRQDNLGLTLQDDPNQDGTATFSKTLYFESFCCNLIPESECLKFPEIEKTCISQNGPIKTYDFIFDLGDISGKTLVGLESYDSNNSYRNLTLLTSNRITGQVDVLDEINPFIRFNAKYLDNNSVSNDTLLYGFSDFAEECNLQVRIQSSDSSIEKLVSSPIKSARSTLKVYPNPAKDFVNVVYNIENTKQSLQTQNRIIVFNTLGQEIFSQDIRSNTGTLRIRLNDLAKGIYYIKMHGANEIAPVKFYLSN